MSKKLVSSNGRLRSVVAKICAIAGLAAVAATAQTDLARGKTVSASSTEGSYVASNAVDGNASSRWGSLFIDNQSITIDLGVIYSISSVKLTWEAASARDYQIEISPNGNDPWTPIAFRTNMSAGNNRVDDITGLTASSRYIRMYGTARTTAYGYSLFSFEVYGSAANYTLTTSVTPAGAGTITLNPAGGSYPSGTVVTVSAGANTGYSFANWSGALTGNTTPTTITMDGNKSLAAAYLSGTAPQLSSLTISPSSGTAPLSTWLYASYSGSVTTWLWNFGDGTTSNAAGSTYHQYSTPGAYTAQLTISNTFGSASLSRPVSVSTPPAPVLYGVSANPSSGSAPLSVNLFASYSGTVTSWLWNFGDGSTSTQANSVSHIFTTTGLRTVNLTVSGPGGSATGSTTVNVGNGAAPQLTGLTASPSSGYAPLTTWLYASYTGGAPTTWSWNFGDGTTSSVAGNTSHQYATPGTYSAALTVSNVYGSSSLSRSITVQTPAAPVLYSVYASPTSGTAPLTVNLSASYSGSVATWLWNFGDGTTSTQAGYVSHVYSVANSYATTLTISNAGGSSSRQSNTVTVNPAPQTPPQISSLIASPSSGNTPLNTSFSVSYASYSGTPTTWLWNFGDGTTSSSQNGFHTYTTAGEFNAQLTVSNSYGSNSRTVRVNPWQPGTPPPVLSFVGASPSSGPAPLACSYFASYSYASYAGAPTSWLWNFGDGSTSTEASPRHTFTTGGSYTTSLTIRNVSGSSTMSTYINVLGAPVLTSVGASPSTGAAPLSTNFHASYTGYVSSWQWDFGDGTFATTQNPSHLYNLPGNYTARVIASGGASGSDQRTIPIVVTEDPNSMRTKISVNGELFNVDGTPVGSSIPVNADILIRLYPQVSGGTLVHEERYRAAEGRAITVSNGRFSFRLGDGIATTSLASAIARNSNLYLEMTVETPFRDVLTPRVALTAVPYAHVNVQPVITALPVIHGNGSPNTNRTIAAIGTLYIDDTSGRTWQMFNAAWTQQD